MATLVIKLRSVILVLDTFSSRKLPVFLKIKLTLSSVTFVCLTIIHLFSLLQLTSSGFLSSIASAAGKSLNMGHGRGVGRGRASRHFDASTSSSFNPNPIDGSTLNWRSQLRNSLHSTTEQGCDLNVIALSTPNGDPLTKDVAGLSPSKTLYHLGWYTGLEMVQY